jgi:hypothetical protein
LGGSRRDLAATKDYTTGCVGIDEWIHGDEFRRKSAFDAKNEKAEAL